jgi:DNA-binding transcriptional regulator YhcF (GntR family)
MPLSSNPRPGQPPLLNKPMPAVRQLKYRHVEAEVRKLAETLPVNAKMPTERDLAATYGCSVLTIRKGLQVLVDEGIIRRRMGSGTFIARHSEAPVRADQAIGILTYSQSDAYAYRLLQSVAHAALEQSIQPRSVWIRNFGSDAKSQLSALRREGCTAFTIPWFPLDQEQEVQDFVRDAGIGISLPQPVPGLENFCFEAPHLFGKPTVKVIELLCRYFSLLGNEHIALLGPDTTHNTILQRQLVAYASAMSRQQRAVMTCLVGPDAKAMDSLAKRWAEHRGKLAVISYDDEHALRLMTAMHKIGLNSPQDFRIVGYNNTEASRFSDPPLSTVAQNFDFIGEWLIRSARALAEGRVEQATEIPDCMLMIRATCGGTGHIDEAFRAKLPGLAMITEPAAPAEKDKAHAAD